MYFAFSKLLLETFNKMWTRSAKISYFNVLCGNNDLYATNMYFLEALIFNGEDDVRLIRKRRSVSGEHSLRILVNAVRYVVRMNSRACLCN